MTEVEGDVPSRFRIQIRQSEVSIEAPVIEAVINRIANVVITGRRDDELRKSRVDVAAVPKQHERDERDIANTCRAVINPRDRVAERNTRINIQVDERHEDARTDRRPEQLDVGLYSTVVKFIRN